jgi:hypothetical protein
MNTKQKAEYYADFFKSINVNDGTTRIVLKTKINNTQDAPQELREAIRAAHGDKMPDDFTYSTFADLLDRVAEYDVETIDDLQDVAHEIVDGYVDIYTYDLLQWLASDVNNVEYLAQAAQDGWTVDDGTWQLLARAQYYAINEVMQCVISLLNNDA